MASEVRAVIDIGTNSVKLLVAHVEGHLVHPLHEESEQTRLGQGFYETHMLQPEAITQTAQVVAGFAQLARRWEPASIRVIATSAARDAINQEELLAQLQEASGLRSEVISGEQEAELAFEGVTTSEAFAEHPLLVLDVGGGSSEFILGENNHAIFAQSFKLGTVRLLEKMPPNDPPLARDLDAMRDWARAYFQSEILPVVNPKLEQLLRKSTSGKELPFLVGTGGTTTIMTRIQYQLSSFERSLIEGAVLTRRDVEGQVARLWSVSLEQRKQIVGLPKKRADVILPGVVIFATVLEMLGFEELHVSTRGLRYAAVMGIC
jgi:exopolyphosphatase/guanosine-5'-triphosphate,3'-diphosphate pyrophosphatase